MLCTNTQAVTNVYSTGWDPRPFSPIRAEIWIWGLKNVYEKRRPNPVFPQDPPKIRWSIIIKSHWLMLCPSTQAVINGYAAGWGPRPFFPKRAEIWIWGWKKCTQGGPKKIVPKINLSFFCLNIVESQ